MLREFSKSFLIYGVAASIGRFISLFMVPIYTRVFSPEQYGEMDIIATVYAFVSIFGLAQLESAFSRYYYAAEDDRKRIIHASTVFWMILGLSVVFAAVLAALAKPLSMWLFNTPQHVHAFLIIAVMVPFSNIFTLFTVMMRFQKRPYVFTGVILFQLLAQVGLSIWLVVGLRMGIIGRFYGQLLGFIAASIVLGIYLRRMYGFTISSENIRSNFRYSLPILPLIIANWVNVNISRFIMLGMLTLADIGMYSVAMKFASVMQLIEQAFRMTWGPLMWEALLKENHRELYIRMMKIISVAIFGFVSFIALFSHEALSIMAAKPYIAAAPILGMLAFSKGMMIISQTINLGPGIRKKTEFFTGIAMLTMGANIGLLFILVPKLGLMGVPLALLIANSIRIVLSWFSSERLYFIGFPKLYFGMAYAFALAVVMLAPMIDGMWVYKLFIVSSLCVFYATLLFAGRNPPMSLKSFRFRSQNA